MHGPENGHMLKVRVEGPDGERTRESDTLCTQCHGVKGAGGGQGERQEGQDGQGTSKARETVRAIGRRTRITRPSRQGSRCIECHMSDVNWRLFTRRRDHTFQPPVPELTARYGVPNACTTCHEDKSPEWAAKTMDAWYGERRATPSGGDDVRHDLPRGRWRSGGVAGRSRGSPPIDRTARSSARAPPNSAVSCSGALRATRRERPPSPRW